MAKRQASRGPRSHDKSQLANLIHLDESQDVTLADEHHLKAMLEVEVTQGKFQKCKVSDVLYNLTQSLLSISKATKSVKCTGFSDVGCKIPNTDGDVVAQL